MLNSLGVALSSFVHNLKPYGCGFGTFFQIQAPLGSI
jgi:hypothetical protein